MTRSEALYTTLADLRGWHLSIHCATCRNIRDLHLEHIPRQAETLGIIVMRLRCSRCGRRPDRVTVADGVPFTGSSRPVTELVLIE